MILLGEETQHTIVNHEGRRHMQRNTSIKIRQQQPTQRQSSSAHAVMTWVEKQPHCLSLSRDVCSLFYDTHHYRSFRWLTPLLLTAPRAFHPLVDLMIWPQCSPNMNRSQKGMPRNSYVLQYTRLHTFLLYDADYYHRPPRHTGPGSSSIFHAISLAYLSGKRDVESKESED